MIIIDDIAQQSPEWYQLHAGVPGASSFNKIVTTKGKVSKSKGDYIFKLAGEKLLGTNEETYQSHDMKRGIALEPEARKLFEFITDEPVRQVAFVFKDKKRSVGCSPDGLIGLNQPITKRITGLEIKCPNLSNHTRNIIEGGVPYDKIIQVQGNMWVCNTHTWYFMSYYPGLEPFILEVERDYKFVTALEIEMESFLSELDKVYKKLK